MAVLKRFLGVFGAAAAVAAGTQTWLQDPAGIPAQGFDIPVEFLADYSTSATATVSVGALVIGLGLLGGLFVVAPQFGGRAGFILGPALALLAVAGAFVYQIVEASQVSGFPVADLLSGGPIIAGIGGVLLAASA